jgi:lipoprotein NlpD
LIAPVNRVANNSQNNSGTKSFNPAVIEPMVELPPESAPENRPPKSVQKKAGQTNVPIAKNTPKPSTQSKIAKTIPAATSNAKIKWLWPARGTIINSNTASGRNGLDIKGKMGQTIKAASAGSVVYSGSGLLGYGRLVIIKHNSSFLSAYAHNSRVLVNEGNKVLAGQPIAEMGNSGTNMVKLHFEIRKDGKSVDPRQYLPK